VNPYDEQGNSLGSSTQSLEPGQRFIGASTDPALNLPSATAWFSLQSQNPLIGFELFGTIDSKRLAGYSVVDIEGKSGIFPKLEKNGWTGIAFVNTESQQATVTLKAYNDAGNVLATGTKILKAHEKWVGVAESLFPGVNLNAATYLSFSSDRNVAGFQLNNSGNTMLDALPSASPSGQKIIDKALGFLQYQSTLSSGMTALTDIMGQILSSTGGTCPQVTVNPPLTNLETLPPAITITASYGNGCTASDGATVSGQVVLAITNLSGDLATNISLDYALTATNLTRNGVLLLNGSVSGHIAINISASVITQATVTVHFDNFQVANSTISGNVTIAASNLVLSGPSALGNVTITFDNLTASGYTVNSGTVTVTITGSGTTQVVQVAANLSTSQGAVNITLTVQSPSDTRTIVNTPTPGTIAGYTVTLTNVTMDTSVCTKHPIGGSVTISQGGSSVTEVFTPGC
jgi:hypothetical protein